MFRWYITTISSARPAWTFPCIQLRSNRWLSCVQRKFPRSPKLIFPPLFLLLWKLRFANSQQSHNFATKDRTSEEPSINTFLRSRSFSMSASNHEQSKILERIKQTNDYKKKGFKSNTRGLHIQETFATLQEMFSKIPIDLGFNIELSKSLSIPILLSRI